MHGFVTTFTHCEELVGVWLLPFCGLTIRPSIDPLHLLLTCTLRTRHPKPICFLLVQLWAMKFAIVDLFKTTNG